MTNPNASKSEALRSHSTRRRPVRASTTSVSCDAAAWTCDDQFIVTSQCEVVNQATSEIIPGSQFIFVWDSCTGRCLLGINGAHSMQCSVIFPHPIHAKIVCSAGADGKACFWDLDTGKCLFSHQNTVDFGPNETRGGGQISAYLDGSFSPEGTELVLTDDGGRVTVLNCSKGAINPMDQPFWMKEQYFANDYYELLYDQDGYCIERGSEQPPHLAPKAARCSHSGASSGEKVNKAFRSLKGPLPLPEHDVLWDRINCRLRMENMPGRRIEKGSIVSQYDAGTTAVVTAHGGSFIANTTEEEREPQAAVFQPQQRSPRLSSNYRWRGYDDVLLEEPMEEAPDTDDDSFHIESNRVISRSGRASTSPRSRVEENESSRSAFAREKSDSDSEIDEVFKKSPAEPRSKRLSRSRLQTSRFQVEDDSEDEDLVEYMSSNNTPSGPFVADYESHYFRIQHNWTVNSSWLLRTESNSSYNGRKSYVPQVGDEVVYIPRAHQETILEYPSLIAPWYRWPEEADWPIVKSKIRHIRYRFPYTAYFPKRTDRQCVCRSIVAIVALELTGIPMSTDTTLWPTATFVTPTSRHCFEVGMFESDTTDFMVPLSLFVSRITSLNSVLSQESNPVVEAFYSKGGEVEDEFLEPYPGTIVNVRDDNIFDAAFLRGSGYQCVHVEWCDGSGQGVASPWELQVPSSEATAEQRPTLSQNQKRMVREAMGEVLLMDRVRECFLMPVNIARYSDYETRVEVPMYLDFVKSRLESNYYSNPLSVLSDIQLIRDNCCKYNGEHDDLTLLANQMIEKFAELILSPEELREQTTFRKESESILSECQDGTLNNGIEKNTKTGTSLRPSDPPAIAADTTVTQRPQRPATRSSDSERPPRQSSLRIRIRGDPARRASQTSRSVLEREQVEREPQPPLVALDAGARGRTTRNSRGQQPSSHRLNLSVSHSSENPGTSSAPSQPTSRATRSASRTSDRNAGVRPPALSTRTGLRSAARMQEGTQIPGLERPSREPFLESNQNDRPLRAALNSVGSVESSFASSQCRQQTRADRPRAQVQTNVDHDPVSDSNARSVRVARRRQKRSQLESAGSEENLSSGPEEQRESEESEEEVTTGQSKGQSSDEQNPTKARARKRRQSLEKAYELGSDASYEEHRSAESDDSSGNTSDEYYGDVKAKSFLNKRKLRSGLRIKKSLLTSLQKQGSEETLFPENDVESTSLARQSQGKIRKGNNSSHADDLNASETRAADDKESISPSQSTRPTRRTRSYKVDLGQVGTADDKESISASQSTRPTRRTRSYKVDVGQVGTLVADENARAPITRSTRRVQHHEAKEEFARRSTRASRRTQENNADSGKGSDFTDEGYESSNTRPSTSSARRTKRSKANEGPLLDEGGERSIAPRIRATHRTKHDDRQEGTGCGFVASTRRRSSRFSKASYKDVIEGADKAADDAASESGKEEQEKYCHSPRRAATAVESYAVPSSSEFDTDGQSDVNGQQAQPMRKREARHIKNKAKKPAAKKRRAIHSELDEFPNQKEWPDLELKHITRVGRSVLNLLREKDPEDVFENPVREAYPHLAKDYQKAIKNPMDFRTIEEERLPQYKSIQELKEDLSLVFRNCVVFNPRTDDVLHILAWDLLKSLDDIFHKACQQLGIRLS